MRTWRKEAIKSAGGTSWRLVAGSDKARKRIGLGRVSEAQAHVALETMQAAEHADDKGERAQRMLDTYGDPATREAAVRGYLLADPGEEALLPTPRKDYGRMTLAEYFDEVFWKVRSDASTPIGVAKATAES